MTFKEFKEKFEHKKVAEYPNTVTKQPIVSVFVLTYQHVAFIEKCLDGILMQKTDFLIEIIIGEDDSTDGTREICMKYAKKHPDKIRLFLHHRENNIEVSGGPSFVFNAMYALYSSKGKYIALCEGDDYWIDPYKLQKQVDFLEANKAYSFSVGGYKRYNIYTKESDLIIAKPTDIKTFVNDNGFAFKLNHTNKGWLTKTLTTVFRKDILLSEELAAYKYLRDIHLFYHLLKKGNGFYFTEEMGVSHVHRGGINSMKQGEINANAAYNVYKELYDFNKDEWTRYMNIRNTLALFNYNLYNRYKGNSCKQTARLYLEAILLTRGFMDVRLLITNLFPQSFKLQVKRILKLKE